MVWCKGDKVGISERFAPTGVLLGQGLRRPPGISTVMADVEAPSDVIGRYSGSGN